MRVMDAWGQGSPTGCKLRAGSKDCWLTAFRAANELPKLLELENRILLKQPICHETYPVSVRGQRDSVGGVRDKNLGRAVKNAC